MFSRRREPASQRLRARVRGNGARLLIVGNGYWPGRDNWQALLTPLHDEWRVLSIDHVGTRAHDDPAWDGDRHHSPYGHADDLLDLLEEHDVHDATYVGHATSGMIGLLAHVALPSAIAHLVLVSPTPRHLDAAGYHGGLSWSGYERHLVDAEADWNHWCSTVSAAYLGATANAAHRRRFVERCRSMPVDRARRLVQGCMTVDLRPALPKVQCAVDLIVAADDPHVTDDALTVMHEAMPQARRHVLAGDSHALQVTHGAALQELLSALLTSAGAP